MYGEPTHSYLMVLKVNLKVGYLVAFPVKTSGEHRGFFFLLLLYHHMIKRIQKGYIDEQYLSFSLMTLVKCSVTKKKSSRFRSLKLAELKHTPCKIFTFIG